jgi:MtN3 and saliva related transmembrane protein
MEPQRRAAGGSQQSKDLQVAMNSEWLGYFAAFLTTSAFVPQAIKTIRTRDTSGISLGMYVTFACGIVLWFLYGFVIRSWPIVVANAVTFLLAVIILALKMRHG